MTLKKISTLCSLLLLLLWSPSLLACDCIAQPSLGIKDWNDTPIIFSATLTEYKKTIQFGYFKFSVLHKYKGKLDDEISMYFQAQKSHTLLHAVKDFSIDKEWIVFAKKEVINGKTHYRMYLAYGTKYCGLSRPIDTSSESDVYISFLNKVEKSSKRFHKFRNADNIVIAEGKYVKKIPNGKWNYYNEHGKIALSGAYKKGVKVGQWLKYATDKDQQQIVIQKQYYESGILLKKVNYTFFSKLKSEVLFSEKTKTILQYRKDQLISKHIMTLDNKALSRYKYRNGVLIKEEHFERKSAGTRKKNVKQD